MLCSCARFTKQKVNLGFHGHQEPAAHQVAVLHYQYLPYEDMVAKERKTLISLGCIEPADSKVVALGKLKRKHEASFHEAVSCFHKIAIVHDNLLDPEGASKEYYQNVLSPPNSWSQGKGLPVSVTIVRDRILNSTFQSTLEAAMRKLCTPY